MKLLTPEQAQELIKLVQETQIVEFFERLQQLGIETTEINNFKKEFISGRYTFDFYERLQVYVNSLAGTNYEIKQLSVKEVKQTNKTKYYIIGIVLFLFLMSGFVWYCNNNKKPNNEGITSEDKIERLLSLAEGRNLATIYLEYRHQNVRITKVDTLRNKIKVDYEYELTQGDTILGQMLIERILKDDLLKVEAEVTERKKSDLQKHYEINVSFSFTKEMKAITLTIKDLKTQKTEIVVGMKHEGKNWAWDKKSISVDSVIEKNEKTTTQEITNQTKERPTEKLEKKDLSSEESFVINGIKFEMILVKGGKFQMGDNEFDDAKPVHTVELDDFYIGKTEVTQKQWEAIMGSNPSVFKNCPTCPVENLTWHDIQDFLEELSRKTAKRYNLPSEAQWEYTARGGQKTQNFRFSGSNNLDEVSWYDKNSGGKTHEVGTKKSNELGIYDMSGNVWEWCLDGYGKDFYVGSEAILKNPVNIRTNNSVVLRGGSWGFNDTYCRVTLRYFNLPTLLNYNNGFRLCIKK